MHTLDECSGELGALLNEALNPALLPDDAERILMHSGELARRCPSEQAAALYRQIVLAAGRRRLRLGVSLSPPSLRLAALEQRLHGTRAWHIGTFSLALQDGEFHADDELTAAETLHFQALVAGPLLQISDLYRTGDEFSSAQLRTAAAELTTLTGLIPACAAEAAAAVQTLIAELGTRAEAADAQTHLQRLIIRLEALLTGDQPPRRRVLAARKALEENEWAAAHADHPRVHSAGLMLRELEERLMAGELLRKLAVQVHEALSTPGEAGMNRALDLINEAHDRAEACRIRGTQPLREATEQVSKAAGLVLEKISADATPGTNFDTTLAAALKRTREAEKALGWLRQLPGALRGIVEPLEAAFRELSTQAAQQSQTLMEETITGDLAQMEPGEIILYATRLQESAHSLERLWGERLVQLGTVHADLATAGDTLDEQVLDRFVAEAGGLPAGAMKDALSASGVACRAGRAELRELLAEMESAENSEGLRGRLEQLRQRFPYWQRLQQALGGLGDLELLRHIRELAGSLKEDSRAEALRLAGEITSAERRERVIAALEHLAAVRSSLSRLEAGIDSLGEAGPGNGEDPIAEVVRQARDLLALVEGPLAALCGEEFPSAWRSVDASAREALIARVPARLERWLERAAPAARSLDEVDRLSRSFDEWARALGAVFHADRGRHRLARRRLDLLLAPFEADEDYDRAFELLREAQGALHPDDFRGVEGRLTAGAALARFKREGTAALGAVVDAILRHGATDDLVSALVDSFTATGVTAHLAAVASQGESRFESFPAVAQLARWCLQFEHEQLDVLVTELEAKEARGIMRDDFLAALAQLRERHAQAIYVLRGVRDHGDRAAQEQVARGLGRLGTALEMAHAALLTELRALETALDEAPPVHPHSAIASPGDIRAAAAAADRVTEAALASVARWHHEMEVADTWTDPPIPRRVKATLTRLRALRTRLQANREVLVEVNEALMEGRAADPGRWGGVQLRLVALNQDAVASVTVLARLVYEHVLSCSRTPKS